MLIIYSVLISKSSLPTLVNYAKHVPTTKYFIRSFRNSAERARKTQNYQPVNQRAPGEPIRNRILEMFRRHSSKSTKPPEGPEIKVKKAPALRKTDLSRLFALAKPEKWRLTSKQ